ncbi:unnamed protein product [Ceratitis capitata]|uniref:(Mediterranean fruit fly) hypothetical protein n=1 Tax=Ceratitis capitata TaxID=7213 RepID=A0A811UXK5_CERCA|nr:unnamed protein product [Ceratitis capitata]
MIDSVITCDQLLGVSFLDTMPSLAEVDKQIIKLREEIKTAKQSLKRNVQNAVALKKHSYGMKRKLEDICPENPEKKETMSEGFSGIS